MGLCSSRFKYFAASGDRFRPLLVPLVFCSQPPILITSSDTLIFAHHGISVWANHSAGRSRPNLFSRARSRTTPQRRRTVRRVGNYSLGWGTKSSRALFASWSDMTLTTILIATGRDGCTACQTARWNTSRSILSMTGSGTFSLAAAISIAACPSRNSESEMSTSELSARNRVRSANSCRLTAVA